MKTPNDILLEVSQDKRFDTRTWDGNQAAIIEAMIRYADEVARKACDNDSTKNYESQNNG